MPRAASQSRSGRKASPETSARRSESSRTPSSSAFSRMIFQEAGRAGIAAGRQVGDGAHLLLGLTGAAGKDGAAHGVRGGFHHGAGRREVIGKAVVGQLAGAAGRVQRAGEAPVVGARAFRFIDPGPGEANTQRAPQPMAEPPKALTGPAGAAASSRLCCWRSSSSCLRSSSRASAARESTWRDRRRAAARLWPASAPSRGRWRRAAAISSRSRCSGARVSRTSKNSGHGIAPSRVPYCGVVAGGARTRRRSRLLGYR